MSAAEQDASRMQADLQLPLELTRIFSNVQVTAATKVASQDAIVLSGERRGLPPVTMYFDAHTGLLIRAVRFAPSVFGLNPTQIDYSDYREVEGVKIPFHWISATPTGRFSIQIDSVTPNLPIQNAVFSRPANSASSEKQN